MPVIEVANETLASRSRTTKDGRRITYKMAVVQQPERARACGQGAKSSTDRRPVDPPPIVDLRVYEGDGPNAQDITFSYRANFFVWATLEHSRTMAQGRGPQPAANTPVLCGTPVAGASYLERPEPAAYFIFPDLSVRHEGNFRISFTLYEDLKEPFYEDLDSHPPNEIAPREYVNGRCEVKSRPFVVFSAKKFPGLSESTALSRLVADQGCRVRIRRDVRMRKRESACPKDWSGHDGLTEERLAQHTAKPQSAIHSRAPSGEPLVRARSNSLSSNVSAHQKPIVQASNEWTSQEIGRLYQQPMGPGGAPMGPQPSPHYYHSPAPTNEHSNVPQYSPSPSPYLNQHPSMSHSPQNMSNPHMTPYEPANVNSSWVYSTQGPPQSPVYGPSMDQSRHGSMPYSTSPQDYQSLPHMPQYNNQSHALSPLVHTESPGYGRSMHPLYSGGSQTVTTAATSQSLHYSTNLPPLRTRDSMGSYDHSTNQVPVAVQPPPYQYVSQLPAGSQAPKRGYGSVFNTQHISEPLRSGARPNVATASAPNGYHYDGYSDNSSDDDSSNGPDRLPMEYRRADGTKVRRPWPSKHNTTYG